MRTASRLSAPAAAVAASVSRRGMASAATSATSAATTATSLSRHAASNITHHRYTRRMPAALSLFSDCIVERAEGSWVHGTNGRKYLDFSSGIGVTNLGHCHPHVNAAVHKQADIGAHLQVNCLTSQPIVQLAEKMGEIIPPAMRDDYQVIFSNSGAESIENAVKLARVVTGRQTVIVFQGGFHGRTIATGAMTTAKYIYRSGFQPTMSGVHVAPFPYCHRCPVGACNRDFNWNNCCQEPIEQLRMLVKQQTGTDEVAAIVIEPLLGEGGYVVPPPGFLKQVRKFADEIGALLVADEVQSGFGRTGTFFAVEQFDVTPDILVMAKGIANGYPLSAIVASEKLLSKPKTGSFGGTYGGNAVSCAASIAVIEAFQRENILQNVRDRGEQFRAGLRDLAKTYPIADVRGLGLMNAIEFNPDCPAGTAGKVVQEGVKNDILLLSAGVYESLRFIPPLTISKDEMDEGLRRLEKALRATFA